MIGVCYEIRRESSGHCVMYLSCLLSCVVYKHQHKITSPSISELLHNLVRHQEMVYFKDCSWRRIVKCANCVSQDITMEHIRILHYISSLGKIIILIIFHSTNTKRFLINNSSHSGAPKSSLLINLICKYLGNTCYVLVTSTVLSFSWSPNRALFEVQCSCDIIRQW